MSKSLGHLISPAQLFDPANSVVCVCVAVANVKRGTTSKAGAKGVAKAGATGSGKADGKAGGKAGKSAPPKSLLERTWPVDVCRRWVAASDYTSDMSLGLTQLLKVAATAHREP